MDCRTIQSNTTCAQWIHLPWNAISSVGLPQAGILANKLLHKRLLPYGYYKCTNTPGLWKHKTRSIPFTLLVDNFSEKYFGKEHVDHLIWCIKQKYELTKDWTGDLYCGIKLNWDYNVHTLDISMPGYIKRFYCDISIACRQSRSIAHMLPPQSNTGPKRKHRSPYISCWNSPPTRSRKSNASLLAYCIMPEPSTSQFSWD